MKPNVDLTVNRDFRTSKGVSKKHVINTFKKYFGQKYPWDFCYERLVCISNKKELFYTGNKKIRQEKKKKDNYVQAMQNKCECCGKELIPWERKYNLCLKCDNGLTNYLSKKFSWELKINDKK